MKIELTIDQGQVLINLLDLAVKNKDGGGLTIAESALFFMKMLQSAAQTPAPVTSSTGKAQKGGE